MARSSLTTMLVAGGAAFAGYELLQQFRSRDRAPSPAPPDTAAPPAAPPSAPSPSSTTKPSTPPPDRGPGPLVWPTLGRWIVPVPIWQGRAPVVSDGWGTNRPDGRMHLGVDLMFARVANDQQYKPGTPNGAAHHVMPDGMVALAASEGRIWTAEYAPRGWTIVIDHGEWATYYTHLERLLVTPTQRAASGQSVKPGDPIGIVGFDPLDGEKLKHLHLELWHGGRSNAVDPEPYVNLWEHVTDPRERSVVAIGPSMLTVPPAIVGPSMLTVPTPIIATSPAAAPPLVATRNLSPYRPVGNPGEHYPAWMMELEGASGVAAIRSKKSGEVLYVGESEGGNLYKNTTRHLQEWRRAKGYPKNNPKEGHDPGVTYNRDSVEVAFEKLPSKQALGRKKTLIAKLDPRDNIHFRPKDE